MQKRGEKAQSKDADRTKTCRHPSQFAKFSVYKCLSPSPREERCSLEIEHEQLVCRCSRKLFMPGPNGEGSEVLMDTFEVDNKGR